MSSTPGFPSYLEPCDLKEDKTFTGTMKLTVPLVTTEPHLTIFLDGLVKRPVPAGDDDGETFHTRIVEPRGFLPGPVKRHLRKLSNYQLDELMGLLGTVRFFAPVVRYAKAVQLARVPLRDRIVCAHCGAVYPHWTKTDEQWFDGTTYRDGWQELKYTAETTDASGRVVFDTDWKDLCGRCEPTAEELAEDERLTKATEDFIASKREDSRG